MDRVRVRVRDGEADLLGGHVALGVGIGLGVWVREKHRAKVRTRCAARRHVGLG